MQDLISHVTDETAKNEKLIALRNMSGMINFSGNNKINANSL